MKRLAAPKHWMLDKLLGKQSIPVFFFLYKFLLGMTKTKNKSQAQQSDVH